MKANEGRLGALAGAPPAEPALTPEDAAEAGAESASTKARGLVRPAVLQGVSIPGGKNYALRRLVYQLYTLHPHLAAGDIFEVVAYALGFQRLLRIERRLAKSGSFTKTGEIRREELGVRALAAELRKAAESLGIVTASKPAPAAQVADDDFRIPIGWFDRIMQPIWDAEARGEAYPVDAEAVDVPALLPATSDGTQGVQEDAVQGGAGGDNGA